jgi:serine/threonine-protein kinase
MTDTSPLCNACERQLVADDMYCPRCGEPTSLNVDPDATIPVALGSEGSSSVGGGSSVTVVDQAPPLTPPPLGKGFRPWFQQVLGTEFEIVSFLGKGGFARVYKARDTRLDRIVAIKVIRPEVFGTELFTESFRNEGIALAKLRHPGIVPIYDIRERDGLIYYIMPFVQGVTLEERLAKTRLPPVESRRILAELADTLSAAHRAEMAHLDIKPDNVFLEGDHQKVLLVDFGIAMAVTETVPDAAAGPIVGTPLYRSPEQAQGLPEIDHRSDIYSLGVLGYCMLLGRPPFTGQPDAILKKHIEEAPPSIRKINPTIPKDFADAIMRCLEKDPWKRFHTTKELADTLEAVIFSTQRESATVESRPGMSGNLVALIVVAVLLLGVLVGGWIS